MNKVSVTKCEEWILDELEGCSNWTILQDTDGRVFYCTSGPNEGMLAGDVTSIPDDDSLMAQVTLFR